MYLQLFQLFKIAFFNSKRNTKQITSTLNSTIIGIFQLEMLGGGAGHIADMIARMRQNRALSKHRRNKSKDTATSQSKGLDKLVFPDPSPKKIRAFRSRMRKERRRNNILKTVVVLIILISVYWFLGGKLILFK